MNILDTIKSLTTAAETLLSGEPVRAIGYGGAAVIYVVAKASGRIPDVSPDEALAQAGAALVIVGSFVETIRRIVYSPNTVEAILAELAAKDQK